MKMSLLEWGPKVPLDFEIFMFISKVLYNFHLHYAQRKVFLNIFLPSTGEKGLVSESDNYFLCIILSIILSMPTHLVSLHALKR